MITWEQAIDKYKVTKLWLLILAFRTNKNICDADNYTVSERFFKPKDSVIIL